MPNRPITRSLFVSRFAALFTSIVLFSFTLLSGCTVAPAAAIAPTQAPTEAPALVAAPAPDNKEIYRAFFGDYFGWDNVNHYAVRTDQTNKYNAFLADLTQDGAYELIVTDDTYGDSIELSVYTVIDGEVHRIYADESSMEPRAKIFGVYLKDDKAYLLVCESNIWQNGGDCSYRVFSLSSDGSENVIIQDIYADHYDPETSEIGEAYYDFLDRQDKILQQATILFRCGEGFVLQSSPEAVLN